MDNGIEFFTATCLNWQPLLHHNEQKNIVIDSLKFLVDDKLILVVWVCTNSFLLKIIFGILTRS